MADLNGVVTPGELERQAQLAFIGRPWRMFLAYRQDTGLNETSTVVAWEAEAVAIANGYEQATGTIQEGSYKPAKAGYELPAMLGTFNATGAGYSYDSVITVIDNATYPHSVVLLEQAVVLVGPQTKTYSVNPLQST
mgnify:CR=1 FL=1